MNHSTSPLVSLAIPIFNGSEFMRFAIDSALAQTYPNVEIIVVNDGSSDEGETENIAQSYGDRISYYFKQNGGVGSALNLALEKSSGEYFCWLSHDDLYLPEKVARQVEFLQALSTRHAVVFCRHSVINESGDLLHALPPPPSFNPDSAAYQFLLNQWLHCCSILAPRSMYLEMGGFREDLPTTQDYDLLMKIGLRYPFFELPEIHLLARSHPNQGSISKAHLDEVERFYVEHIPMLSSEYMCRCFSAYEILDAWVELIVQLRARNVSQGVIAAFGQLLKLEFLRANPCLLFDNTRLVNSSQPFQKLSAQVEQSRAEAALLQAQVEQSRAEAALLQAQVEQSRAEAALLQAQVEQSQAEAALLQAQVKQLSLELTKSWRNKMKLSKSILKRIISRAVNFGRLNSTSATNEIFDGIYKTNYWRGESRSGEGSDLIQTQQIREVFPELLKSLQAKSMLDIPCGDFFWMQHVDLPVTYIGADIVQEVVNINNKKYADTHHKFMNLDVCTDELPEVDLIFARDLLVHLSYNDIQRALQNMKNSGAIWLLTTTFTGRDSNTDIKTGDWRTLNLQAAPFNLPEPVRIINENCTQFNGDYNDKSLGLWKLQDIKIQ
jgi:glycosyltransferase involved in cell wall biosynthesis